MIPKRQIDFYGDQTRWFLATVKSLEDPLKVGRIQVRIIGIHSDDQVDIPDENLPYAQVVTPITEGGTNGLGNPLGIQVGSMVFGLFLDGPHSQLPLIFGSVPKLEGDDETSSVNSLARGPTSSLDKTVSVKGAPADPYKATYPNNKVTQTSSGHIIEIDDTDKAERIHIRHKSGSFVEFHPDGSVVIKTTNVYIDAGTNANIKATNVDVEATDVKVAAQTVDIDGTTTVNIDGAGGDVVVSGISLVNHTHSHTDTAGIGRGTANTKPPNKG
tara:strand:+ start:363 stop:1178 length:816 start_codon:yes stop_codon:yes gene_type:complete